MPVRTVLETSIQNITILDENGGFDAELGKGLIPDKDVVRLYEHMGVCRHFDEVAFKLQRSGRMGTYPENRGQEAVSLGAAYALQKNDWLVPCYRENCGLFWRGLPMEYILLHWMGDERGNQIPDELAMTPQAIPIGTQMLHAVGLAWAAKYRKEGRIACTFFGDGATSEGDFHEALNFAANLDIPCVFVCQNNGWAISLTRDRQTASETIAQKADAYGMPGVLVDGNDLLAVYAVAAEAVDRARRGEGPTLIEALTYRMGPHTTADDDGRYRTDGEVAEWRDRDPVERMRAYLKSGNAWSEEWEQTVEDEASAEIEAAVDRAEALPPFPPGAAFDRALAVPSAALEDQRDRLLGESR